MKHKTVKGVMWSGVERFSVQGIQFILGLIMARILSPEDFGVVGMLTVFTAIAQSFIDSGFSNALIRKLDRTDLDCSTAFYFNVVVGIVTYWILFLLSPLIADFYKTPILDPLTKVVGINVFVNSLAIVQRAQFTINVDFKTQAKATTTAVLISGIVGIVLAYLGYGVWSIAVQQVLNNTINVILLWLLSEWRPHFEYSWKSFRELFNYGYKLLISGLIDTIYRNIYLLIIGKFFSAKDLGNYTRAHQFSDFPSSNITGILQRVTFPILSSIQNDDERLRRVYRKYLRLAAFVVFPLMMGLAALSSPLILFVLTDKWIAAVPLLQILCFAMMWYPVHAINLNLLQVKGRSDLFLRLEVLKKLVGVGILCVTIPMGLIPMIIGSVISSVISLFINTYYTGKLINVGFFIQMHDLFPIFAISLLMGIVVYVTVLFIPYSILKLMIGVVVGIVTYYLFARICRMEELYDCLSLVIRKNIRR